MADEKKGIFDQLSDLVDKNLPGLSDVQKSLETSLGRASNLSPIPSAFSTPSIDPNLQAAIDSSFANKLPILADTIIEQSGLKELMASITGADVSETKKETKSAGKSDKKDTTPTQKTNTPVKEATQSREEGRSQVEQLFLDLINGKIDLNIGG